MLFKSVFLAIVVVGFLYNLAYAQIEKWIYRYNGTANTNDVANTIICGLDGNIYVAGLCANDITGNDPTVISLTPEGSERWVYTYDSSGYYGGQFTALDYGIDGNLYVAGTMRHQTTHDDFTVLSLTPSGDERWMYTYHGSNWHDRAYSMVLGPDSNIYAAGCTNEYQTGADFTVISLTSAGVERWVYHFAATSYLVDQAASIVYGLDGNLYAVGTSVYQSTSYDITVVSLSPSGTERWVYRYAGAEDGWDWAYSVVCGTDGNIYLVGFSYDYATDYDFVIISLSSSGDERWVYHYNGPVNKPDFGHSIAFGTDGYIYAAGRSRGTMTWNDFDFVVLCLDTTGREQWVYRYDGPGYCDDRASSLVYDKNNNIYAAGYSTGSGTGSDFTVISLMPNGGERWHYRYTGPGSRSDEAKAIVWDPIGNVYAAGSSEGIDTGEDIFVVCLDTIISGIKERVFDLQTGIQYELSSPFFSKSIEIKFAHPLETSLHIVLYDVSGTITYETSLSFVYRFLQLNDAAISKLPVGIYFLQLETQDEAFTKKIIKVR